jgi:hypothetical protein
MSSMSAVLYSPPDRNGPGLLPRPVLSLLAVATPTCRRPPLTAIRRKSSNERSLFAPSGCGPTKRSVFSRCRNQLTYDTMSTAFRGWVPEVESEFVAREEPMHVIRVLASVATTVVISGCGGHHSNLSNDVDLMSLRSDSQARAAERFGWPSKSIRADCNPPKREAILCRVTYSPAAHEFDAMVTYTAAGTFRSISGATDNANGGELDRSMSSPAVTH